MKTNVLTSLNKKQFPIDNTKSPFAIYENEELIKAPHNPNIYTISSIKLDIDKAIILLTSRYKLITSSLLTKALNNLGINTSQHDLQKRLKILAASEFLEAKFFVNSKNPNIHSSNKVYSLGWRGAGYLKNCTNEKLRLGGYINDLDAKQAKKLLATVQFLIHKSIPVENIEICETVFVKKTSTHKIFRPQAIISEKESAKIFIEAVRKNENWQSELLNKMERIADFSTSLAPKNIAFNKHNSKLVLIAENTEHMKEVIRFVNSQYLLYPIKIIFSADTLIYEDSENSLFTYKPTLFSSLFTA